MLMPSQHVYLPSNRSPRPGMQLFNIAQPFTKTAAESQGLYHAAFGSVSCHEYECEAYLHGYTVHLPVVGDNTDHMRLWLRQGFPDGLKRFATETHTPDGLVAFRFEAGQPCLKASTHRWVVRPPVWMHDRNEQRRILRHDDFKDLMNEEGYKVNQRLKRG